ncbi:MAG: substrate-binding domain-containing protein, partial [Verrucomicrobiaceae bacterium]|nr:substrate-binding domain-containing protein [Verrucomicrobiaceae bacterium]
MRRLLALLLLSIATLIAWQAFTPKPNPATALTVYCAAGLKKPIEALALQFEQDTGTPISLQYGGTGTLLSQIQVAKTGDLFIAADDGSLADASKINLVAETLPIAVQHPVIAVKKGNPKAITDLTTLQSSKFALANPDAASISKVTRKLLGDARWTT